MNTGPSDEYWKEELHFCRDENSGLVAIIAIHDTSRGPALGGCRMWPYPSESHAISDVLRLARGMSYKCALADLPFGGGKSVMLGDPSRDKSERLLRAFGRFVDRLGGRHVAAEDVGMSVDDIEIMARETEHVAGRARGSSASGDPSPHTAEGVLVGIRACSLHRLGTDQLDGIRIAVQGLGHVGLALAERLHAEGAALVVSDLREERVREAVLKLDARAASPDEIYEVDVDLFAPCALGAIIDAETVQRLGATIVAGSANNQLGDESAGDALAARGILYAPDYVINAGGVINVAGELCGHYDRRLVEQGIAAIGDRLSSIFAESEASGVPPHRIADARARRILAEAN